MQGKQLMTGSKLMACSVQQTHNEACELASEVLGRAHRRGAAQQRSTQLWCGHPTLCHTDAQG